MVLPPAHLLVQVIICLNLPQFITGQLVLVYLYESSQDPLTETINCYIRPTMGPVIWFARCQKPGRRSGATILAHPGDRCYISSAQPEFVP